MINRRPLHVPPPRRARSQLAAVVLDIQIEPTTITIRGHRSAPPLSNATQISKQRPEGTIERRIDLDEPVTGQGITATYTDGVLTLTIPTGEPPRHHHDLRWPGHVTRAVT